MKRRDERGFALEGVLVSCIPAHDPQLARLADAIAQRVGPQRFSVWFSNSTKMDLKHDGLEIAVPNDFISEWIGSHFTGPIQEAAHEVLGCPLAVRFSVVPQLFDVPVATGPTLRSPTALTARAVAILPAPGVAAGAKAPAAQPAPPRMRHDLESFVVGASNQLAYNVAVHVAEFPGVQYNPAFIHGGCGLGKSHLLQGICRAFMKHHPTKRWMYMTGEEFTNDFLSAMRNNRLDAFRRKVRDLDLLVIDDVHFLAGKKATQEEFLHTFNSIEAMGKQVVMASDNHPKMIEEFGESLVNRFVSGMVVRIDPPHLATRCQMLQALSKRVRVQLEPEVVDWIARRVTQNVRELEGAVTRLAAHVKLTGRVADLALAQEVLGDLERQLTAPIKPEAIVSAVCAFFNVQEKDLLSGGRQRTISLARSMAMYLVRKIAKLSFPEIGQRLGKRNHSTVISACRRIERALSKREKLDWTGPGGDRAEDAAELVQRLEELSRQA